MQKKSYRYIIGIDTGVQTGYACYDKPNKRLVDVSSAMIHEAMEWVRELAVLGAGQYEILARVEDPRQAVFFREFDKHRAKGAGSVMRDAKIWDDFLKDLGVDYEMVRPRKEFTKLPVDKFQQITGYFGRTSQHGRDAAMLVYGY